jgi:ATP synthase protein I
LSNQSPESTPNSEAEIALESFPSSELGNSMTEYYQLQRTLLLSTLVLMGIIAIPVWYFYSLNIALNYLLGAVGGLIYLRLLAKEVERLGHAQQRLGAKGLGLFIVLMVVATQWQQLHILPVFLGFLTYKAAILFHMLQTLFVSVKE